MPAKVPVAAIDLPASVNGTSIERHGVHNRTCNEWGFAIWLGYKLHFEQSGHTTLRLVSPFRNPSVGYNPPSGLIQSSKSN